MKWTNRQSPTENREQKIVSGKIIHDMWPIMENDFEMQ